MQEVLIRKSDEIDRRIFDEPSLVVVAKGAEVTRCDFDGREYPVYIYLDEGASLLGCLLQGLHVEVYSEANTSITNCTFLGMGAVSHLTPKWLHRARIVKLGQAGSRLVRLRRRRGLTTESNRIPEKRQKAADYVGRT